MEFYEAGEEICCDWMPGEFFQGYRNVLHGGIQATLMDEIASWIVQVKLKTAGVTAEMTCRYWRPIYIDAGRITIRARIMGTEKRLASMQVTILDASGSICSEGTVKYFLFPENVARERYHYPGVSYFFGEG
jgi:uncharacterized protein (TIGR00369 family)